MSIFRNLKIEAEVDHNIPNGSIVYFNTRYKKWYRLKKGYKNSHKLLGLRVENGIITRGGFKLTADSEIGRLVAQNGDEGTITIKMGKNEESVFNKNNKIVFDEQTKKLNRLTTTTNE